MGEGTRDRTDDIEMARQGENAQSERWFGVAGMFGLSGTRDGIDMHGFIDTAGGITTD
jgi:hypothetical protein